MTSYKYNVSHDRIKFSLACDKLNEMILDRFKYHISKNIFYVLEILNYLRIAPYLEIEKEHIDNLIRINGVKKLHEAYSSNSR